LRGAARHTLGAEDWRPAFRANNLGLPSWFDDEREDLSERLRTITTPVLRLSGDADPISPVAVGRRLQGLFPRAGLVIFQGGTHDLIMERAVDVAPHIDRYLAR
jgi:pimeloyl-ACP methyl ester carboxylesterase